MSRTVQLTMRMDAALKEECKAFFDNCGLSISQGIQLALRAMLREGNITIKPRYNMETEEAIQEAKDILSGRVKSKRYASFDDAMTDMKVAEESK